MQDFFQFVHPGVKCAHMNIQILSAIRFTCALHTIYHYDLHYTATRDRRIKMSWRQHKMNAMCRRRRTNYKTEQKRDDHH